MDNEAYTQLAKAKMHTGNSNMAPYELNS